MKSATVYGMVGYGATKSDAKKDAEASLYQATKGYYTPEIVEYDGYAILIYRTLAGWRYSFIQDAGAIRTGDLHGTGEFPTKDDARRAAVHHLANISIRQLEWYDLEDVPAIVEHEEDRRELVRYAAHQRAYRHARNVLNMGDTDAHAFMCNHYREFTQRPEAAAV